MGPPQKKELKKNVPPPEHPVSTQDTNFSSPPPIPAKTRHERKNKSSNVPRPESSSGPARPAHGPVFFSDNEDIESDTRTQRDSHIPSVDEEDFHSFVRHIGHTTKQKGIEVESDSEGEDDAEDRKDQENLEDDDDEGEDDEDDREQRYIKEENLKIRYPPL